MAAEITKKGEIALRTREIMNLVLELAGLDEVPPDSGIIVPGKNIKKLAFGIDMEVAELLLARDLGVDAVVSHHPKGGLPMVDFHKVMYRQIDRMVEAGIPINKAQKVLQERVEQVDRSHHVGNYDRVVSAAQLLNMPYMVIHSPADILTEKTVQAALDRGLAGIPKATLRDVLDILVEIPEYQNSPVKPVIRVGSEKDYAGKVFVVMAGGTNGGEKVARAYFEAGVGTLVAMHMPDDVIRAVREQNIGNIVVAGHMPSDSIGINKIIAALEARGVEVIRMSGVVAP